MRKLLIAGASVLALAACIPDEGGSANERGSRANESNMQRALDTVPVPRMDHFLTREAVNRWLNTMDVPGMTFYIYVLSPMTGQPIGYFVGQHRPVNICVAMTPPEHLERADLGSAYGETMVPAPGLDGVYYTGAACDSYYFWDDATGRYLEIGNLPFFISNAPLRLDVPRIEVVDVEDE